MHLLVLGGTRFVGRHIAQAALARGHEVTVFSRGRTPAPAGVRALTGDRDGGLDALRDGAWDVVVDVSGYLPRHVRDSTALLSGRARRYLFVSSVSVYAGDGPEIAEDAPLLELEDPTVETVTGDTYGGLKVLCERAAEDAFAGEVLSIRPAFVVGPDDYTDRFPWWLRRVRRGGPMAAPIDPGLPTSFVDVRDLGRFVVHLAGTHDTGAVNAAGPAHPADWGEVLETARRVTGSDAQFVWLPQAFLEHEGVEPGALPMVVPFRYRRAAPFAVGRAHALGLAHTPLETTVRDTLAWFDEDGSPRAGLSEERERALLTAWDRRSGD